jgi:hypothetical protein
MHIGSIGVRCANDGTQIWMHAGEAQNSDVTMMCTQTWTS